MFNNRPALRSRSVAGTKMGTSAEIFGSVTTDDINSDVYLIRERVQRKLLNDTDGNLNNTSESQLLQMIETSFNQVIVEENLIYTRNTRAELLNWVVADILGYGPLEPLLKDPTITEVMCNGPEKIYIERRGMIELTNVVFENEDHLMRIIHRIVAPLGRRVDESSPMVDARLPSGYRVNATISPLSLSGPLLTIRKFATITIRQLVINALRMRPDRIIVGEARGAEALDMLQAMNTGHDGSMSTIHSNSPRDTLRRIETMVLMAGLDLPLRAIREQVASAIELVVHLERLRDGTRRVVQVTEVQGMEGESVVMQDLFVFDQTGVQNGRVLGKLKSTGLRPKFSEKFEISGIELPANVFDVGEQV